MGGLPSRHHVDRSRASDEEGGKSALYTVGHGTLEPERFAGLLAPPAINHLVDVRTAPGSRRSPQFVRTTMERWLPGEYGVEYRWEPDLGGFRRSSESSLNTGLRHLSFRGYADYMETQPFRGAFDRLLVEASEFTTVIMCSEAVWWRCHRRLIADAATLLADCSVLHLLHDGRMQPHAVTPEARIKDGHLRYLP
jgi:uncharacterized protein (DUF488 family)